MPTEPKPMSVSDINDEELLAKLEDSVDNSRNENRTVVGYDTLSVLMIRIGMRIAIALERIADTVEQGASDAEEED
jgi:hypothetical protein